MGDIALKFFTSYLTERRPIVPIGRSVSDTPSVINCVPRGSSLGPLLFILFINDIPLIINTCETHLFVDDTTLTRGGSSIYDVNPTLQETVDNMSLWASQNQMAIHPYMTKVMLLGIQKKLATISETLHVNLEGTPLIQSNCDKFLGVYIDPSLTWNNHASTTIKKYNSKFEMIGRIKPFLGRNDLIMLYNSLAKPTMEYSYSGWGNCSAELVDDLLLAQKRAARIILNAHYTTSTSLLFKKLNIIPIGDAIRYRILIMAFKILNNLNPPCFTKLLSKLTHRYPTRYRANNHLFMPKARINAGKWKFAFIATSLWNTYHDNATTLTSLSSFKIFSKNFFKKKLNKSRELENIRLS